MRLFIFFLSLFFALAIHAQENKSNSGESGANSDQTDSSSEGRNSLKNEQQIQGFPTMPWDRLDDQIEYADPGNGTIKWKGKTFNVTSSRAFRSRFERYLNETHSDEDAAAYLEIIEKIQDLLAVSSTVDSTALDEAFGLLFEASKYSVDGGTSQVLANLIHNAWRARNELSRNRMDIMRLEAERDSQRRDLRSSTAGEARMRGQREEEERRHQLQVERARRNSSGTSINVRGGNDGNSGGGGSSDTDTPTPVTSPSVELPKDAGITQTQIDALNLTETEIDLQARKATDALSGAQARLHFQSQLVQLMTQRKFQHVLIGVDFYRQIFKSSGQTLEVGKQRMQQFIPDGDFVPTVDSLGALAKNIVNDVESGMSAVVNAYNDQQRISALERLQETFFIGEYLPSVQLLNAEMKRDFRSLYQKSQKLTNLLDLKDYDGVDKLAKEIAEVAEDFSSEEILAATRTQRTLSNLSLDGARQAGAQGDLKKADQLIKESIEYWPLNPAIQSFSQVAVDRGDARIKAQMLFDDSFSHGEERRIYDRRMELGVALQDDPVRSRQLTDIVKRLMAVDGAIAQAEELQKRGLPYQAWEFLAEARKIAPNDGPLSKALADLSPQVALLVAKLDKAKRLEEQKDYPASLMQYLDADKVAPTRTAREGAERTTSKILEVLSGKTDQEELEDENIETHE